ncbi:tRNA lysidin [Sesbania bispinosa]|nr:tRNA lysidin [Sesbania bispinosa]
MSGVAAAPGAVLIFFLKNFYCLGLGHLELNTPLPPPASLRTAVPPTAQQGPAAASPSGGISEQSLLSCNLWSDLCVPPHLRVQRRLRSAATNTSLRLCTSLHLCASLRSAATTNSGRYRAGNGKPSLSFSLSVLASHRGTLTLLYFSLSENQTQVVYY